MKHPLQKFFLKLLGITEVQWEWRRNNLPHQNLFALLFPRIQFSAYKLVIGIIITAYAVMIAANHFNPFASFTVPIYIRFGFAIYPLVTEFQEYWRMLSAVFLHFNLLHIIFNTMALRQVGPCVEEEFGSSRFFIVFLVTGICGNILQFSIYPEGILAGASGSIFGMIGFCGMYAHRIQNLAMRQVMFQWALYSFIFGLFLGGVANLAHLGGFLSGIALAWVIPPYLPSRSETNRLFQGLALLAWAATIFTLITILRYQMPI